MHFSVPDSQELYGESTGSTTYTAYNIYINGAFHCCLRYKQLHALHEQLRRRCCWQGATQLPDFPPKRLLPLTNGQLETRRAALEHYLQLVGQDGRIAKLEYFQQFLLSAQHETALAEGALDDYINSGDDIDDALPVEVLLTNGYRLQVNCRVRDSASALLHKVCQAVQLPTHLMAYFCLFLMRNDEAAAEPLVLLRRLMDFEAPFLSRLRSQPCHILLRTAYWDPTLDASLLPHAVALNLLYIQAIGDVEREWIIASPEVRQKLYTLQQHGLKKEFLEITQHLPLYGCLQFAAAQIDYPEAGTSALISIGNKELSMRTVKGPKIYQTKFRVTRMRCWRVTALHNATPEVKDASAAPANLQLSFEYLMAKQTLRWITITSAQAMLMSVCLQAMVDELLTTTTTSATENGNAQAVTMTARNGHHTQSTISSSSSSASSSTHSFSNETATRSTNTTDSSNSSPTVPLTPTPPVQFFVTKRRATTHNPKISNAQSYAAVFFRNRQDDAVQQNEAFEAFDDDDL